MPSRALSFFIPGKLANPLNGSHGHWAPKAAIRRAQREVAAMLARGVRRPEHNPGTPKRVTLMARTWNAMDSDGLQAACKPIRDGLVDGGLIHSDAKDSGHVFCYSQVIDRKRRGVLVAVETLE